MLMINHKSFHLYNIFTVSINVTWYIIFIWDIRIVMSSWPMISAMFLRTHKNDVCDFPMVTYWLPHIISFFFISKHRDFSMGKGQPWPLSYWGLLTPICRDKLCICPVNERQCYNVTSSLIDWAYAQNYPSICTCSVLSHHLNLWLDRQLNPVR